jgi:hypothetical protein
MLMELPDLAGRETELLTFMRENGYPVFHRSNIFLRDLQYGIRDFCRNRYGKDPGSRKCDLLAEKFIGDMELKGLFLRSTGSTWILQMEGFLNKVKEKQTADAAA